MFLLSGTVWNLFLTYFPHFEFYVKGNLHCFASVQFLQLERERSHRQTEGGRERKTKGHRERSTKIYIDRKLEEEREAIIRRGQIEVGKEIQREI